MKFGVLGQLEVNSPRGVVRPAGLREQKILAVLLLGRGAMVPVGQLVDAVWDEEPPATARRQIQNCMSALRRQLAADGIGVDLIASGGPGYRIRLSPDDLDATVFDERVAAARALAEAGDPAQAVTQLRAALRLWRGAALAGLGGRRIGAAAARLEEQRLTAIQHRADLELSLGRAREVVADLTALVAEHPTREGLVGQLMLALYRSGRQGEALRLYAATREVLRDELGLDPGRRLQDLHGGILRGAVPPDAAPAGEAPVVLRRPAARPAAVPAQLPADVTPFAGRRVPLKVLDELLSDDPPARICVVAGMAGIGKTTMVVHWAHRVAARFADGQLYLNLRGYSPAESAMTVDEALGGLLDALGVPPGSLPTGTDAQAALFRSLVTGRRMLLVLDDVRDAAQIRPLLPGASSCLVLVTSRQQLFDLLAFEAATLVVLDPLAVEEARELLARRLGLDRVTAERAATDDIIDRCARLPLALAIVAARARTNPAYSLRALADALRHADGRLDALTGTGCGADVRTAFSFSYRRLSVAARRLFRLLGLQVGPDIAAPAAASLDGTPLPDVQLRLAELAAAHLVVEHTFGRYAMHDLVRAYAAELARTTLAEPERRAATRRLLDHYLHSAWQADRSLHEHRHVISLPAPEAGVRPEHPSGRAAALAWFTAEHPVLLAAVRGAAAAGLDRHAWQLGWAVATYHDFRGAGHDWLATQRLAAQAAERLGDPLARAHTHRGLGRACLRLGRVAEARRRLHRALAEFTDLDDAVGQARTHLDLAWGAEKGDEHRPALHHYQRALECFRVADHLPGQVDATIGIGRHAILIGDHERGLSTCQQAVELAQRVGQRHSAAGAWDGLGCAYHHLGRHRQAVACHRRARALFRAVGARYCEAWALANLADALQADGGAAAARTARLGAAGILDDLLHPDADRIRERL